MIQISTTFSDKIHRQRQAAATPSHLTVVYYSLGVPKSLDRSKVSSTLYYWKRATKFGWDSEAQERNRRKKCIRGVQETKAFGEIPRLPKKRTVTDNVCTNPPSSPSFPQGVVQLTLKEKERITRTRSILPCCPTAQSPTGLLHPKQQPGRNAKPVHLWATDRAQCLHEWGRESQAYHREEKMQNRSVLVALSHHLSSSSFMQDLNYFSSQKMQILNGGQLHCM